MERGKFGPFLPVYAGRLKSDLRENRENAKS